MKQSDFEIETDLARGSFPPLPPGNALFRIELNSLPSFNDFLYKNRDEIKIAIGKERGRGYEIGIALGKALKIPLKVIKIDNAGSLRGSFRDVLTRPVTDKRLFCLVKIWRKRSLKDGAKSKRRRDIYNLAVKALIDGLTDAGVWIDDSEEYHNDLWISYKGVADETRIIIKFYELED